jgi:hypothetical protein
LDAPLRIALFWSGPLLGLLLSLRPVENFDLGYILRLGEWIAAKGIPTTDPFSFPGEGQPWALEQWLGPLAFWKVWSLAGLEGLILCKALVVALTLALAGRVALRTSGSPQAAALATLLAAVGGAARFNAQPFVFSFLGFSAVLWAIVEVRRGARAPLLLLPPLFGLWVHVHPGYLSALALLGLAVLGGLAESLLTDPPLFDRRFTTRSAAGLGVALAASFAAGAGSLALFHPLGLAPLANVLRIFFSTTIRDNISEFAPLWRSYAIDAPLLLLFAGPSVGFLVARRRLPASLLILQLFFAFSALRVGRLLFEASLAAVPVLAPALAEAASALRQRGAIRQASPAAARALAGLTVGAALVAGAVHLPVARRLDWPEGFYPRGCYSWIDAQGLSPRGFNDLWFGASFIFHFAPRRKTFIDNRSFYSDRFFTEEYGPIKLARPGWQQIAKRWGIDWYLLVPGRFRALHAALQQDPGMRLGYADPYCAIYVKKPQ